MKFTEQDRDNIIKEYLSGSSSLELAKKYECNKSTICDILRKKNVKTRDGRFFRKYSFNEKYFDNIDSKDKAYFLGLLFADGCNQKERNQVTIELIKEDENILKNFVKHVESDRPLLYYSHKKGKDTAKMCLTSKYFCKKLEELGCVPRKSLILQFPQYLSSNLIPHFIRGYFDGDGGITIYKTKKSIYGQVSIVSSKAFIESLGEILKQEIPEINFIIRDSGNGSSLVICRKKSVMDFLSYIYKDSSLYLERKFSKYEQLINK